MDREICKAMNIEIERAGYITNVNVLVPRPWGVSKHHTRVLCTNVKPKLLKFIYKFKPRLFICSTMFDYESRIKEWDINYDITSFPLIYYYCYISSPLSHIFLQFISQIIEQWL